MDFTLPPPALLTPLNSNEQLNLSDNISDDCGYNLEQWMKYNQKRILRMNQKRVGDLHSVPKCDRRVVLKNRGAQNDQEIKCQLLAVLQDVLPSSAAAVSAPSASVHIKRMTGAMTNCMFLLTIDSSSASSSSSSQLQEDGDGEHKYLFRVYGEGSEKLFSRDRELKVLQTMSCLDIGPHIIAKFANGRIEQFIQNYQMTSKDIRVSENNKDIAASMFEIHSLIGLMPLESDSDSSQSGVIRSASRARRALSTTSALKQVIHSELEPRLMDWFNQAVLALPTLKEKYPQRWSDIEQCDIDRKQQLLSLCINHIKSRQSPVVFCHCDSQYGNILRSTETGQIVIIDYEYACYAYRGFDLANHFCEWMANYHCDRPHWLDADKFPTREEQIEFVDSYLTARDSYLQSALQQSTKSEKGSSIGSQHDISRRSNSIVNQSPLFAPINLLLGGPSPVLSPTLSPHLSAEQHLELRHREIEMILKEVEFFVPISHLMWSLWAFIQASQSTIDFDYVSYALQRFHLFEEMFDKYVQQQFD
ncbi:hypothetical protein MP228_009172 [Amoeboaphelidium protococcarum]|nr:hypothetical protein MP228_009172 [Amoeboaphelidium protococcarum]